MKKLILDTLQNAVNNNNDIISFNKKQIVKYKKEYDTNINVCESSIKNIESNKLKIKNMIDGIKKIHQDKLKDIKYMNGSDPFFYSNNFNLVTNYKFYTAENGYLYLNLFFKILINDEEHKVYVNHDGTAVFKRLSLINLHWINGKPHQDLKKLDLKNINEKLLNKIEKEYKSVANTFFINAIKDNILVSTQSIFYDDYLKVKQLDIFK